MQVKVQKGRAAQQHQSHRVLDIGILYVSIFDKGLTLQIFEVISLCF